MEKDVTECLVAKEEVIDSSIVRPREKHSRKPSVRWTRPEWIRVKCISAGGDISRAS
jgi:hypothetical protein